MRFHGGKARIGKKIATFMLEETKRRNYHPVAYVEPFSGMLGVYRWSLPMFKTIPSCKTFIASDIHKGLILMWQKLQTGWVPPTKFLSPERFFQLKYSSVSSAVKAWYGYAYGYMGKYFVTYDSAVTPKGIARCALKMSMMGQQMKEVQFSYGDYKIQSHHENCVLYLDSPYIEYSQYYQEGAKRQPPINFPEFWDWCRDMSKKNLIFISAYSAPPDFEVVFEIKAKTPSNYRREKLYMLN